MESLSARQREPLVRRPLGRRPQSRHEMFFAATRDRRHYQSQRGCSLHQPGHCVRLYRGVLAKLLPVSKKVAQRKSSPNRQTKPHTVPCRFASETLGSHARQSSHCGLCRRGRRAAVQKAAAHSILEHEEQLYSLPAHVTDHETMLQLRQSLLPWNVLHQAPARCCTDFPTSIRRSSSKT